MFVLEALLLTLITTPIVTLLCPPEIRVPASTTGDDNAAVDNSNVPQRWQVAGVVSFYMSAALVVSIVGPALSNTI